MNESGNVVKAECRVLQVPTELENLKHAIDSLDEEVQAFRDRLDPVLSEATPCEDSDTKDSEVLSPIANEIKYHRNRIHTIKCILNGLSQRLEI